MSHQSGETEGKHEELYNGKCSGQDFLPHTSKYKFSVIYLPGVRDCEGRTYRGRIESNSHSFKIKAGHCLERSGVNNCVIQHKNIEGLNPLYIPWLQALFRVRGSTVG